VAQPSPEQLITLYKIAVDVYRFEVKLNWDRAMYYMVFNTATIGAGASVVKLQSDRIGHIFGAAIFLLGVCTSIIGSIAIRRGHEYYRRSVVKKTLLEDLLGLTSPVPDYPHRHTLAIGSTAGQGDHIRILHDPRQWIDRRLRRGSITFLLCGFLWLLAALNLVGLVVILALVLGDERVPLPTRDLFVPVAIESNHQICSHSR
jgi:hypothetical protein